jgi:DNA modification methylase
MANTTQTTMFGSDKDAVSKQPVECLGIKFPNDDARRQYFLAKLREKLKDPEFRKIDGFPRGEDEDILAMSDPPYYTACPNPFLHDFLLANGHPFNPNTDKYHREPFAADVSEGKNDPIYNAHSYHTKVPHKAIMRYILHYTEPGDVVFDGFCGTGMAGIAAQLCGDASVVGSLGYKRSKGDALLNESGAPFSRLGPRRAVLSDLSPVASFIAHNYNTPLDVRAFEKAVASFFAEIEDELSWMYTTKHSDGTACRINYVVWSEVFLCQDCGAEVVFSKQALNEKTGEVLREFACQKCNAIVSKRTMSRVFETFLDPVSHTTAKRVKRLPLTINYTFGGTKFEKQPDKSDLAILAKIESSPVNGFFPAVEMPYMFITHVKDRMANFGISHFSHFFLPRSLRTLATMWRVASRCEDARVRHALLFMVEQCNWGMSLFARYVPTHFSQVNQYLSGVFYISSQIVDVSPWYILDGKSRRLGKVFASLPSNGGVVTSLHSGTAALLPSQSVDYIFTDPPFGENLQYSELNWLTEEFYRLKPKIETEAVINAAQKKGLIEYQGLMEKCFEQNYRVLKPGRWMTVEFHNSRNAVWNAIQEAMQRAGFVVADVRVLDKQHKTYKQQVQGVVKADLIISAYKPSLELEERFKIEAGTEKGVWDFLQHHLQQLPSFVENGGRAEVIAERQGYLLFDRMVAFHVQRGVGVFLSAPEFYAGLRQRYPERDGMYFLPIQANEYDRKRLEVEEIGQYDLFVSDEKSAIQWVRRQLSETPMDYQQLQPMYMKEAQRVWEKHEQPLELRTILEQNFVEGKDGTWHVPDPKKESDLDQLRNRALLKEFQQYLEAKGKLKVVRTEALRAGFKDCWQRKSFATIVQMAKRLPEAVIQEDPALLMYFDNASLLAGE